MPGLPDWRDAAAYTAVRAGGRLALAWESLRRDSTYRSDVRAVRADDAADQFAAAWGLHFRG